MSYFRPAEAPFIIAGPCSAETREQVLYTAEAVKNTSVHLFRAGVWKPRTRPGSFEGMGELALSWLQEVKSLYGLPVAIEVAEPAHVELALRYGIDVFWIGARTTVNPFLVQVLADTLKGVNIPVMIKNPVTPDVSLWEGAIERFERAGITDIAAIHRGFTAYQSPDPFRNHPNWIIPIELKRRRNDLPVFCDPSHITGDRNFVPEIAQKALDMGFDGLMIETHPNPEQALTDAAQQVTPDNLKQILGQLVRRRTYSKDMDQAAALEYLRQLMDGVDMEIIDLLARRMEISKRMGKIKKAQNMAIYDPERWCEMLKARSSRAKAQKIPEEYILSLYEKIHHESIRLQLDMLDEGENI